MCTRGKLVELKNAPEGLDIMVCWFASLREGENEERSVSQ
jgi:hypothetical protein